MKKFIKAALLCCALGFAVFALLTHWQEVRLVLAEIHYSYLLLAGLGLLAYQVINAGVWSQVLTALGKETRFIPAARLWLECEALRWIPGGIWGYGSRVVSSHRIGINKVTASSSLVLEILLTNLAWGGAALLLFGSPIFTNLAERIGLQFMGFSNELILAFGVLVVSTGVLLRTQLGQQILEKAISWVDQKVPLKEISLRKSIQTFLFYLGLCFANGALLWVVTLGVPPIELSIWNAIGVAGVAWLVGFWAIGVPGGIGVREAALAWLLSYYGPLEAGMAIAVIWRGLQIIVELIALGGVLGTKSFIRKKEVSKRRKWAVVRLMNIF